MSYLQSQQRRVMSVVLVLHHQSFDKVFRTLQARVQRLVRMDSALVVVGSLAMGKALGSHPPVNLCYLIAVGSPPVRRVVLRGLM